MSGSPSTGRGTKASRTRQRILESAAAAFAENGYAATRLSDIAQRAGMQTGSLYYHFPSREALVADVLHVGMAAADTYVRAAVERAGPAATPLERLRAAIAGHVLVVLDISVFASAQGRVFDEVPAEVRAAHLADQRRYGDYWHDLLVAAQRAGALRQDLDLFDFRVVLFGAMNAAVSARGGQTRQSPEKVSEMLCTVILDGATAPEARQERP